MSRLISIDGSGMLIAVPEPPPRTAYLTCPECGEDAIPASASGCQECGKREGKAHDVDCGGTFEPLWDEDDGGPCPGCGVRLRVVVDDVRAYAEVAA